MNIPSNEYMKKVKKLARDGKIHPGNDRTYLLCMRDGALT